MATNIIEIAIIIAMTEMIDMDTITVAAETEEEKVSAEAAVSGLILRQRTTGITTTGITSDRQITMNQTTITGTISIDEAVDDEKISN